MMGLGSSHAKSLKFGPFWRLFTLSGRVNATKKKGLKSPFCTCFWVWSLSRSGVGLWVSERNRWSLFWWCIWGKMRQDEIIIWMVIHVHSFIYIKQIENEITTKTGRPRRARRWYALDRGIVQSFNSIKTLHTMHSPLESVHELSQSRKKKIGITPFSPVLPGVRRRFQAVRSTRWSSLGRALLWCLP